MSFEEAEESLEVYMSRVRDEIDSKKLDKHIDNVHENTATTR